MDRPAIYLSNSGSKRTFGHHGPGRMICAMANPRSHERGVGRCYPAAPARDDLFAVMSGRITEAQYRNLCEVRFAAFDERRYYEPSHLGYKPPGADSVPVNGGDTLVCGCARWAPGKVREHPCHLELLAPFLARAGWAVVLWGRPYDPALHTPESFGWPAVEVPHG